MSSTHIRKSDLIGALVRYMIVFLAHHHPTCPSFRCNFIVVSLKWSLGGREGGILQLAKEQPAHISSSMSVLHTPQLIRVNFICAYNPLPKFLNKPALTTAIPLLVVIVVYRPFLRAPGKT